MGDPAAIAGYQSHAGASPVRAERYPGPPPHYREIMGSCDSFGRVRQIQPSRPGQFGGNGAAASPKTLRRSSRRQLSSSWDARVLAADPRHDRPPVVVLQLPASPSKAAVTTVLRGVLDKPSGGQKACFGSPLAQSREHLRTKGVPFTVADASTPSGWRRAVSRRAERANKSPQKCHPRTGLATPTCEKPAPANPPENKRSHSK